MSEEANTSKRRRRRRRRGGRGGGGGSAKSKHAEPKRPSEPAPSGRLMARLVYKERDSPFPFPELYEVEGHDPAMRLGQVQRSLGVVHGVLQEYNAETREGLIEVGGSVYPCFDARPKQGRRQDHALDEYVGHEVRYSFWPSFPMPERRPGQELPQGQVERINISHVRYGDVVVESGHVEVIGRLTRIWAGGCAVTLWSKARQRWLSTVLLGDYPDVNHIGQWVWVSGKLSPEDRCIHLEQASILRFVDAEAARAIIAAHKAMRAAREAEEALERARREAEQAVEAAKHIVDESEAHDETPVAEDAEKSEDAEKPEDAEAPREAEPEHPQEEMLEAAGTDEVIEEAVDEAAVAPEVEAEVDDSSAENSVS